VQLDAESNKLLTETIDAVTARDPNLDIIVRMLTTRCMQRAQYFAAGTQSNDRLAHDALAMPICTHFTSPIRRYCNLIVHKQLPIALGYEAPSDICASKLQVSLIADNLNFRHRMAQEAGLDLSELFMMEMLRKMPNRIEPGKVTQIKPTVFVVLLEQFGVDGEKWSFSEQEETLSSGSVTNRIFDTISVRVNVTPTNIHGRSRLHLVPVFD
jgi:exosome complex exonuclease DIS3/RRP44